jgi:hypothetical protein
MKLRRKLSLPKQIRQRNNFSEKIMNNLTVNEAYAAMFVFLEKYYERTKSDDVGGMLGQICLLSDGSTADPATWGHWLKCVKEIKPDFENKITVTEVFAAMRLFVVKIYSWTQIAAEFSKISFLSNGEPAERIYWTEWLECVEAAQKGNVDLRLRFI